MSNTKSQNILILAIIALLINAVVFFVWYSANKGENTNTITIADNPASPIPGALGMDSIERTIMVDIVGGTSEIETEKTESGKTRVTSVPSGKLLNVNIKFDFGEMLFVEGVKLTTAEVLAFYGKDEFPLRVKVMYNSSGGMLKGFIGTRYLGDVKMSREDAIKIIHNVRNKKPKVKSGVTGGS